MVSIVSLKPRKTKTEGDSIPEKLGGILEHDRRLYETSIENKTRLLLAST